MEVMAHFPHKITTKLETVLAFRWTFHGNVNNQHSVHKEQQKCAWKQDFVEILWQKFNKLQKNVFIKTSRNKHGNGVKYVHIPCKIFDEFQVYLSLNQF